MPESVRRADVHSETAWPAVAVTVASIGFVSFQLLYFEHASLSTLSLVAVFFESMFALIVLGGVYVSQLLRDTPRLYLPMMLGTTLCHVFSVTKATDGVVALPNWFDLLFEDVTAALGAFMILLGLYRWVNLRDAQRRRLQRQRDELARQNNRLEEFTSTMSHDLRNPLTVAEGYIELAIETGETDHLNTADRALTRMNHLLSDGLALLRRGVLVDEANVTSVRLADAATAAWDSTPTNDTELNIDGGARVEASETHLQRLFANLFRNVVEHAGSEVTVRVGTLPDGDGFYVEDDGRGISVDERERLFEAEYGTVDGERRFGLRFVKQIATAHGWTPRVTSGTDGGVRFEFTGVESVNAG